MGLCFTRCVAKVQHFWQRCRVMCFSTAFSASSASALHHQLYPCASQIVFVDNEDFLKVCFCRRTACRCLFACAAAALLPPTLLAASTVGARELRPLQLVHAAPDAGTDTGATWAASELRDLLFQLCAGAGAEVKMRAAGLAISGACLGGGIRHGRKGCMRDEIKLHGRLLRCCY